MADKITRSTRHPVYDMEYEREYCTSLVQHANLSFTANNVSVIGNGPLIPLGYDFKFLIHLYIVLLVAVGGYERAKDTR